MRQARCCGCRCPIPAAPSPLALTPLPVCLQDVASLGMLAERLEGDKAELEAQLAEAREAQVGGRACSGTRSAALSLLIQPPITACSQLAHSLANRNP